MQHSGPEAFFRESLSTFDLSGKKKQHATRRRASTHSPAKLGASLPVSWNGPLVDPNSMAYRISHSVGQPACSGPHANKARSLRIPQLLAHSLSYLALFGRPFQSGCSKENGSLILICPDLSATASKEPPDSGHPPANAWSERTAYSSTSRDKSPDCKSGSCWHDPRCTLFLRVPFLVGFEGKLEMGGSQRKRTKKTNRCPELRSCPKEPQKGHKKKGWKHRWHWPGKRLCRNEIHTVETVAVQLRELGGEDPHG